MQTCKLYQLDFEIVVFPHLPLLNLELKSDYTYRTLWKNINKTSDEQIHSVLRRF